jgi:hypothetical protein
VAAPIRVVRHTTRHPQVFQDGLRAHFLNQVHCIESNRFQRRHQRSLSLSIFQYVPVNLALRFRNTSRACTGQEVRVVVDRRGTAGRFTFPLSCDSTTSAHCVTSFFHQAF